MTVRMCHGLLLHSLGKYDCTECRSQLALSTTSAVILFFAITSGTVSAPDPRPEPVPSMFIPEPQLNTQI